MDILNLALVLVVAFLPFLGLSERGLRGIGMVGLLAFSLTGAALAEPGEGPRSTVAQSNEESESTDPHVVSEWCPRVPTGAAAGAAFKSANLD